MKREEEACGKAAGRPGERRRKRVEKVGGEEKCGKERVNSWGNKLLLAVHAAASAGHR